MIFAGRYGKIFVALGVGALLLVGSMGFVHFGMGGPMDGTMGTCPFMPGVTICNMTPMQHIAAAQSMFNVLPQDKNMLSVLLLLVVAFVASSSFKKLFQPPLNLTPVSISTNRYFRPRSVLQEAFSRGILNPKIF